MELSADDLLGQKTLAEVLRVVRPDILFLFTNTTLIGELDPDCVNSSCKLLVYLKVDDFPIPISAGCFLDKADLIVTMSGSSRSGILSQFPSLSADKVRFLYSPADIERFKPLPPATRLDLRKALLPYWMPRDAFVLGWVGTSCWRKQVWLLYKLVHYLRSGKYLLCQECERVSLFDWDPLTRTHLAHTDRVLESRPGYRHDACASCRSSRVLPAKPLADTFLWLHMPEDGRGGAWPLHYLEQTYGVQRNRDIYYSEGCSANAALAPEDMPALYQLWDGLMYLSGAEGFGLPAWEAMCSALPVVYTNVSSHAEYLNLAGAGLPVGGILQPERKTGFWRMIADLPGAIEAVRKIYFNRELGQQLGANGRAFVEQYCTEIQVDTWHRIFQGLRGGQDRPPDYGASKSAV